jgi:hypothetical protein
VFVGHAALALAAKTRARSVSLGWLFAAAFGLDLLWPIFLLIEERAPSPDRRSVQHRFALTPASVWIHHRLAILWQ